MEQHLITTWNNSSTTANINNLSAGNYILTITDALGCQETNNASVVSINTLTISATVSSANCNSQASGFINLIPNGTAPYSFQWSDGSTLQNRSGLISGNYSVTATDANGCTVSNNTPIAVYGQPLANFGFTISNLNDLQVQFTDSSSSAQIISWNFDDGNSINASNPVHTYSSYGIYNVSMIVSNPCGQDTLVTILNLFPTSSDRLYDECSLSIYPNPSTGLFNMKLNCTSIDVQYSIEIYNAIGKKVKSYQELNVQKNIQQVDLTSVADGIYFINLKNEYGQLLENRQIILQK